MTKDERFLLELYKQSLASDDPDKLMDPDEIGQTLGYKKHLITNILKGLMQANLIKRYSPTEVALTKRGKEVARTMLK